jgi:hypothetical protein
MFVLFLSKMLIRLTLARNMRLNVMILKKMNYVIYIYIYIFIYLFIYLFIYSQIKAANVYLDHWPTIYFLMA